MGAGIAQVLLEGGREVVGRELDEGALVRARAASRRGSRGAWRRAVLTTRSATPRSRA